MVRVMAAEPTPFAALLRRFRLAAALSQEGLAEGAGMFPSAISALERGVNRKPYLETVRQLASALSLDEARRESLLAAARPEGSVEAVGTVEMAPSPSPPAC